MVRGGGGWGGGATEPERAAQRLELHGDLVAALHELSRAALGLRAYARDLGLGLGDKAGGVCGRGGRLLVGIGDRGATDLVGLGECLGTGGLGLVAQRLGASLEACRLGAGFLDEAVCLLLGVGDGDVGVVLGATAFVRGGLLGLAGEALGGGGRLAARGLRVVASLGEKPLGPARAEATVVVAWTWASDNLASASRRASASSCAAFSRASLTASAASAAAIATMRSIRWP
ncbi:hypothetical protein ET495_11690 [Xylanimonas allomyrinae]|uniref:Uncharacterized protein n=1 Tax=Xylanimonas allomyrinae TaxID=2509459 RepID=A0A4P6EM75_9MICO|nr:hypothetical protein [Xylanimonas allomyrinae]QAY63792.1 hypothetical protein ET495_11690 [Xylanimonas allomyrinae]